MCCNLYISSKLSEFDEEIQHDSHDVANRSTRSFERMSQKDDLTPIAIDRTLKNESWTNLQTLVIVALLFLHFTTVDASSNVTQQTDGSSGVKQYSAKPYNTSLSIDTSLSHPDTTQTQGGSSSFSSLPDNDEFTDLEKEACLKENQFWNEGSLRCENCTVCGPGTQHDPQSQCGFGIGVNATCKACLEEFYQENHGYSGLLRCRRCVLCDNHAETLAQCSPKKNTQCGPCPPGKYYGFPNICLDCIAKDDHPDCADSFPENPSTQPPAFPPSNASPSSLPAFIPGSTQLPSQASPKPSESRTLPPSPSTPGPKHRFALGPSFWWLITIPVAIVIVLGLICYKRRRDTPSTKPTVRYDPVSSKTSIDMNGDGKTMVISQCTDPSTSPPPVKRPLPPTPPGATPDLLEPQGAAPLYPRPGQGPVELFPPSDISVAAPLDSGDLSGFHTLSSHPQAFEVGGIGFLRSRESLNDQGYSDGPQAMGPEVMGQQAMGPPAMGLLAMGLPAMGPQAMGPPAMGLADEAQWPNRGAEAEAGSSAQDKDTFDVPCQRECSHLPRTLDSK